MCVHVCGGVWVCGVWVCCWGRYMGMCRWCLCVCPCVWGVGVVWGRYMGMCRWCLCVSVCVGCVGVWGVGVLLGEVHGHV